MQTKYWNKSAKYIFNKGLVSRMYKVVYKTLLKGKQ